MQFWIPVYIRDLFCHQHYLLHINDIRTENSFDSFQILKLNSERKILKELPTGPKEYSWVQWYKDSIYSEEILFIRTTTAAL